MASTFKPKDALREAQSAEKAGNNKIASKLYAAVAQYLLRKEKFNEALVTIDRAILLSPESARLYVQKARIALSLGKEIDAHSAMKEFSQYTLLKKRIEEYSSYMESQLGDAPSLRTIFYESLLEIERTSSFAFIGLARALKDQNHLSRARAVLLSALQTKDRQPAVLSELKEVLGRANGEEALQFLGKFESGDLNYEDLVSLLGTNAQEKPGKKSPKKTENTFAAAEFTEEKNLKTLIEDLEKELGITVDEGRDKIEPLVKEFRRRSEKVLGNDAQARIDMAVAFFEMGLYRDAIDTVKDLAVEDPLYLTAQGLTASIHLAEGSTLAALEVYQAALRNEHLSAEQQKEFLYQTAEIYRKLGDNELALDVLGRLEKIVPGYRESHRIKIAIKESLGEMNSRRGKGKTVS